MGKNRAWRRIYAYILLLTLFVVNTITFFQFQFSTNDDFVFHSEWHPLHRSERFPSVEERVKLYMSNWYLPPCHQAQDALRHRQELVGGWPRVHVSDPINTTNSIVFDSILDIDTPFLFHADLLRECAQKETFWRRHTPNPRIHMRKSLLTYCSQVVWLTEYMNHSCPIIGLFGDQPPIPVEPPVPFIGKWRAATQNLQPTVETKEYCWDHGARKPLSNSLYQGMSPVLWKLETHRHWDSIDSARRQDIPWKKKKLGALWRGDYTGVYHSDTTSPLEQCLHNQRCSFVYNHANSKLIDAGISSGLDRIDDTINGITVVKPRVSKRQIQLYKVIISMEGNDVASGLKWSLLSESVVLMPTPTRSSWAMEELLQPWLHYIPMHPNGSNAEELIRWVENNDMKAWNIAERGRMFMYDLLYHPDAARDEELVRHEIARRYRALWQ